MKQETPRSSIYAFLAFLTAAVIIIAAALMIRATPQQTGQRESAGKTKPRQQPPVAVKKRAPRRAKPPARSTTAPAPAAAQGTIAIVIDDVGYNKLNLPAIEHIRYPLTFSVLPNLPYSSEMSKQLNSLGFELMVHLPMEPKENRNLEQGTILLGQDDAQINGLIGASFQSVPFAKGVSNHMGSRATEDPELMRTVLGEFRKRRLFFLDSVVTSMSVCTQTASEVDIPSARRDIFLDNRQDKDYIREQLRKTEEIAMKKGQAIAIGHDRKTTIEVLGEEMPAMAKKGFVFVFISDIVK